MMIYHYRSRLAKFSRESIPLFAGPISKPVGTQKIARTQFREWGGYSLASAAVIVVGRLIGTMISVQKRIGTSTRRRGKPLVLFAGILIIIAQLFALGHFHQRNSTRQFNAQNQVVADDTLCALCGLAFHAPVNPAATPAIACPYAEVRLVEITIAWLHLSSSYSSCQTRAPPAASV